MVYRCKTNTERRVALAIIVMQLESVELDSPIVPIYLLPSYVTLLHSRIGTFDPLAVVIVSPIS